MPPPAQAAKPAAERDLARRTRPSAPRLAGAEAQQIATKKAHRRRTIPGAEIGEQGGGATVAEEESGEGSGGGPRERGMQDAGGGGERGRKGDDGREERSRGRREGGSFCSPCLLLLARCGVCEW